MTEFAVMCYGDGAKIEIISRFSPMIENLVATKPGFVYILSL